MNFYILEVMKVTSFICNWSRDKIWDNYRRRIL